MRREEGRKKEELHTARTSTGKDQLLKPKETKEELLPPAPILKFVATIIYLLIAGFQVRWDPHETVSEIKSGF